MAASNRSFEKPQLWGLALERNFGECLSAATLKSFWRIALGNYFVKYV